jgi:pimeloyl-ACP methyl ester carboxylesterase
MAGRERLPPATEFVSRVVVAIAMAAVALVACAHEPHPAAASEPGRAYADVNGLRMYYEIHGRGRPILLLHGGVAGQSPWPKTIAALAKDHQVIAPEQMGHGRTPDIPTREFSYAQMAADTFALLEKLGIRQVDIVGWSDGGVLGLLLAIEHPRLVRRLVTSGTNVDDEGVPPPRKAELEPADLPAFFREAYEKYSPDGLQHYPAFLKRVSKMWGKYPYFDRSRLKEIRCPTMIVAGNRDFTPQVQTIHISREIPGAQLMIVPGTGHGTFRQRPELMNLAVLEFLDAPDEPRR